MTIEGFAAAAVLEGGAWRCSLLATEILNDLDGVITAARQVSAAGAGFVMIAIDDEFFVLVRPVPGGAQLLLSDATAALDYDIAADVLDLLHVPVPDEDDLDEPSWAEGDLAMLADLGVPEEQMQIIVDQDDLYPDEQLQMIATSCGFADQFAAVIDTT